MKLSIACAISMLFLAGGAFAASDQQPATPQPKTYYYWLHPKLGMVKVDRATNAIITSRNKKDSSSDKAAAARTN